MANFLIDQIFMIIISFISGVIFYLIIEYLISKFKIGFLKPIFTDNISTNSLTTTWEYTEILRSKLKNEAGYDVYSSELFYFVLNPNWTEFDIENWISELNNQDYSIIIEIYSGVNYSNYLITTEFIINNKSNHKLLSDFIKSQAEIFMTYWPSNFCYVRIKYHKLWKQEKYLFIK